MPFLRAGLVIVGVVAVVLVLAYCVQRGVYDPTGTSSMRNPMWVVYGLLISAVVVGVLAACCPRVLPLSESVHAETFVSYRENLLPQSEWVDYVKQHADDRAFAIDRSIKVPDGGGAVLVQYDAETCARRTTKKSDKPNKPSQSAPASINLPLTTLDHERASAASRKRSYVFRVWVTARSMDELRQTTNPFHLRYTTRRHNADDTPLTLDNVHYRFLHEPDTTRRTFSGHRWYHVESSRVTFPDEARSVFWRIDARDAAERTRYWAQLEVQHHRDGASANIEPANGLQALYTTFLTRHPFGDHKRTWKDESGYDHPSRFVDDRAAELRQGGGVVLHADRHTWLGPASSVLLGDLNASTSNANHVTAFTMSFCYLPPSKRSSQATHTLFTVYADHRNWYRQDNPPNYFFRVNVNLGTQTMQLVQQDVGSTNSAHHHERKLNIKLRNQTDEPVLYTLVVQRQGRGNADVSVYANAQHESTHADWLDINYNLNADRKSRILWGDAYHGRANRAPTRQSVGTLYAFLAYSRALDRAEVRALHRYLFRSFYSRRGGDQRDAYRYHTPYKSGHGGTHHHAQHHAQHHNTPHNDPHKPSSAADHRSKQPTRDDLLKASPAYYDSKTNTKHSDHHHRPRTHHKPQPCSASQPCQGEHEYCDFSVRGQHGTCQMCPSDCATTAHAHVNGKRDCRDKCAPKIQPPFRKRSQLSDAQYAALTPTQKMDILDDVPFNRCYRKGL